VPIKVDEINVKVDNYITKLLCQGMPFLRQKLIKLMSRSAYF